MEALTNWTNRVVESTVVPSEQLETVFPIRRWRVISALYSVLAGVDHDLM